MLDIPTESRRKSEATTHVANVSTPHHYNGGKGGSEEIKDDRQCEISERRAWIRKRRERTGMCILPMFSQIRAFGDWISEFDCWFTELDSWLLSDVLDKMAPT